MMTTHKHPSKESKHEHTNTHIRCERALHILPAATLQASEQSKLNSDLVEAKASIMALQFSVPLHAQLKVLPVHLVLLHCAAEEDFFFLNFEKLEKSLFFSPTALMLQMHLKKK